MPVPDTIVCGDCLDVLPIIPDQSVDAVITDPPYPCIRRDYGYWTEAEWWALIVEGVIPQVRRILKPTGNAVFILQPNSRRVGTMALAALQNGCHFFGCDRVPEYVATANERITRARLEMAKLAML